MTPQPYRHYSRQYLDEAAAAAFAALRQRDLDARAIVSVLAALVDRATAALAEAPATGKDATPNAKAKEAV